MTKLTGDAKVVRGLSIVDNQSREITVTVTARGLTYKAKGCKIPITFVDHEVAIAAGQKVVAREAGIKI